MIVQDEFKGAAKALPRRDPPANAEGSAGEEGSPRPSAVVQPTRDLERASRDLAEQGYCILAEVLDDSRLALLRARLDEQAEGERLLGVDFRDGGPGQPNQRIWMLLNKGRVFRDLMVDPIIDFLMTRLLGPDFLLSSLTANIAQFGGRPMALHTDQNYVGFWTPQPAVANIAWMLDDFTEANGGTRLVPGSHLLAVAADGEPGGVRAPTYEDTIAAEAPAGSILCFDGRLWHGTGANRTDQPRRALLSYHCRPFLRQQENFTLGLDRRLWALERPELLDRLGFKPWAGLGRVESPIPAERLEVDTLAIGPLSRTGETLPLDA